MSDPGNQNLQLSVHNSVHAQFATDVVLNPAYYSAEKLIQLARSMIDSGEHSVATVVLHMACEIAVESCMSAGYRASQIQHLEEPIGEFLSVYSFRRKGFRQLYNAITGDEIHNQGFWSELLKSTYRRNLIVHGGLQVGELEANASFKAVLDAVRHISKREKALRS